MSSRDIVVITTPVTALLPACDIFDYCGVPPTTATALRTQAARIRTLVITHTTAVILAGAELIDAKESLKGRFCDWVQTECGFSLSTAENYMRANRFAEGRIATVAILSPATVYRLAAKSTPPDLASAVLERVAAGEVVSDGAVIKALNLVRHQKREEERKQKLARRRRPESKKMIEIRATDDANRSKREQQERTRIDAIVSAIIERLGEENARLLIQTVAPSDAWGVIERLIKKVGLNDVDFLGKMPR